MSKGHRQGALATAAPDQAPDVVIERIRAKAARDITLFGRTPQHDMLLSGKKVHYGTAGAAVSMVDPEGRNYRESTLRDLYDAARITDI